MKNKVVDLKSVKISCTSCTLSQLCLPRALSPGEFDQLASLVQRERPFKKGEQMFKVGQPFKSLFAVRSGSVKVYIPTHNGEEHIVGFHMPGELLGFDAMGHDVHNCTAEALETSSICELPYHRLHSLSQQIPGLNEHFMTLMSNEIADEHNMMLMLGRKSAEERIASFLLSLSSRFHNRGFSATEFNLSMSRQDMGNYLGLAVETISRTISHLQDENIISVDRKYFQILNISRLKKLANVEDLPCLQFEEQG